MNLDYLLLCDKATIREGLLHVLGGGIQVLWRDRLPAPMGIDLVISLSGTAQDLARPHQVEVTVKSSDGKLGLARAELAWTAGDLVIVGGEDATAIVPLVVPLQQVGVPSYGHYSINVRLDKKAAKRIDFLLKPPSEMPVPAAGDQRTRPAKA